MSTNNTIQPFCVKTEDFTEQEIIEIHHLAVETGAEVKEYPKDDVYRGGTARTVKWYKYFGVDGNNKTWFDDTMSAYHHNVLHSMQEVCQHLEIKQEKTNMKNSTINQQTKQIKSSNKGPKTLPKTSNLLVFVYNESEYTVRGVTNYEIVHESPSLFLKYDFHRVNQSGHVQGSDKVKILGDLEKIVFKVPSDHNPNVYKQKTILNLKN